MVTGTKPRITLLARADNTGLGVQTWEFYKHMQPHKTYVIDLTQINKTMGKQTDLHLERFPDGRIIEGLPDRDMIEEILEDTDVLFTVETPYSYLLFDLARQRGVKTILQYNFEFLDYLNNPNLPAPDLLLAPSVWHYEEAKALGIPIKYLPVPIDRQQLPFMQRNHATHFLHVAGHPTYKDRNGTWVVLEAMKYVKSPITLTIATQSHTVANDIGKWITAQVAAGTTKETTHIILANKDYPNHWDIYNNDNYDVLLLPRRYGGLSLQLNEAMSVGMPVIMPAVSPQNSFLPLLCQIPVLDSEKIMTRTEIDCYNPDPVILANKIDYLFEHPKVVKALSQDVAGQAYLKSWEVLQPTYQQTIEELCQVVH